MSLFWCTLAAWGVKRPLLEILVRELELGLIQTQMAQNPMLRAEVHATLVRVELLVPETFDDELI